MRVCCVVCCVPPSTLPPVVRQTRPSDTGPRGLRARSSGPFSAVRTYTVDLFGGVKTRCAVRTGLGIPRKTLYVFADLE